VELETRDVTAKDPGKRELSEERTTTEKKTSTGREQYSAYS
jgi:hypothetical protein